MGRALDDLIDILELEQLEVNLFRGVSPDEDRQRVFGGQVAGQALVAAGRTVEPDRHVHSLHAYFLRPGDPRIPIIYEVDRIRDGKSFTTRRVVAIQHGRPIFNLSASFQIEETGPEHQYPMPNAPDPETLPTIRERLEPYADRFPEAFVDWIRRDRPIDTRSARLPRWLDPEPGVREAEQDTWFRADGTLPDDPLLHACVVVYASDLTLLDTAVMAHARSWDDDRFMMASLDHAMWFHRPFRADKWLLYHQKSPSAVGARGLAEGFIYTQDGKLAIMVIQEGLIRPVKPDWEHV
ncbi:MAG TPA: acyl-CoA thioesterase II [Acidimicrobiia bacterium]|nr:acyl-CoA thioesterase II [Acidimicrobiia bacterium]